MKKIKTGKEVGKFYVFLIGIDEYKGGTWDRLKNAVNDVKVIEQVLRRKYNTDSVIFLYNDKATRANIFKQLKILEETLNKNDKLLIYFSGHGFIDGTEGYWVPVDCPGADTYCSVPNSEIKKSIGKIKAKHTFLIVDACYSGSFFRSQNVEKEYNKEYIKNMLRLSSRQALSSGGYEVVSDGTGDHSPFAQYLIKKLKENKKKYLDADEIASYLKKTVPRNSRQQPRFGYIPETGDEGGSFVFVNSEVYSLEISIKEGEQVTYKGKGQITAISNKDNLKYEWKRNGITLSNAKTKELIVITSGIYTVEVQDDKGNTASSSPINVEITPLFELKASIKEGKHITFKGKGILHGQSNIAGAGYSWQKDGEIIPEATKPTLMVYESGLYNVKATLPNGQTTISLPIDVKIETHSYGFSAGISSETNLMFTKQIKEICDIDLPIEAFETQGGVENFNRLLEGVDGTHFAILNSDVLLNIGYKERKNKKEDIKLIFPLFMEEIHVITLKESPIENLNDLNGKKVSLGTQLGQTYNTAKKIQQELKLKWTDIYKTFDDSFKELIKGEIDAVFLVAGSPTSTLGKLSASFDKIKLIPIENDALSKIYSPCKIKKDSYKWLSNDISTYGLRCFIAAYDYKEGEPGLAAISVLINLILKQFKDWRVIGHAKWNDVCPQKYKDIDWEIHRKAKELIDNWTIAGGNCD